MIHATDSIYNVAKCTEIHANFYSWCSRNEFFQSELISEILKIFAARSTKCNTLHRRNPRSISVFRLEWTIKVTTTAAVTFAVTSLFAVKFALRANRLSFANWSVGVENTGRLSDTVRSQKPPLKFTHAFSGVYSGAALAQACAAPTKGSSDKVKNEGRMDRSTYSNRKRERENKSSFIFCSTMAREIWVAETSQYIKTYRRW